jgi:hypothetical protein
MTATCAAVFAALNLCTAAPEEAPAPLPYSTAQQEAKCLTKTEARAAYPGAHIYWHGHRHCWDDQPGRRRIAPRAVAQARAQAPKPSRESKPESVSDPNGNKADRLDRLQKSSEVYYPALIREQAAIASDLYAVQRPITQWPLMLDIDVAGPDPDNGIDGCCWPNLQALLAETRR